MLKRRLKQAGLPAHYSPHSFRATGITNFLENDGTLEAAQRIAGHADSRTTKLYDRRNGLRGWRRTSLHRMAAIDDQGVPERKTTRERLWS
jgi:integrase